MEQRGKSLVDEPLHLGLNATTTSLSKITGSEWYETYAKETKSDGCEGRLVSMYTFSKNWDNWEMHPHGEEAVICIHGSVKLIQEINGMETKILLSAGEYAVNPKGVWHTADVEAEHRCTVMFITPGQETQIKPRNA